MTRRITVRSGSIPRKVVPPASVASAAGADSDAIHDNVDGEIVLIDEKVSPVGADVLLIEDSEASDAKKRVQITNLPGGADADAIHDNVASEISAIAAKGSPDGSDFLLIEDAAAANVKKSITIGDLPDTSDHATPIATHAGLPDSHHDETHDIASHSDTTATGAELETLTDGSETALHSHAGGGASPLTTKGDLFGYDTDDARVPVGGTDGHVLVVDSAEALGVKWAAGAGGTDSDAIHDNVDGEIVLIDEKVSPVGADVLLIEDSENGDAKKRVQITNLPGGNGAAVPVWISHLADRTVVGETVHADDDEFSDGAIDGAWTLVQPSGSQEIVEARGVISIRPLTTFTTGDIAAYLKTVTAAGFPLTIEMSIRVMSSTAGGDFMMVGPTFTDGIQNSSAIMWLRGYVGSSAFFVSGRAGTLTSVVGGVTTLTVNVSPTITGISYYFRTIWKAANTFKLGFSADGITWIYSADYSKTLTPTHMGFCWSTWGDNPAGERWATHEYFRVTEADLSL